MQILLICPTPPEDAFPRAKELATKALQLDSNLVESNVAMAYINLYYDWNYKEAEKYFNKAFRVDSNLAMARVHYGWMMDLLGHKKEAEKYMRSGCDLDPMVYWGRAWLAAWYWQEKRYDEAEKEAKRVLELNPNQTIAIWTLGGVYADEHKYDRAIALYKKYYNKLLGYRWALGRVYAQAGMRKEALEFINQMDTTNVRNALGLASIYSSLGDMDNALKWASITMKMHHPFTAWLGTTNLAGPLKKDPRFEQLMLPITKAVEATR